MNDTDAEKSMGFEDEKMWSEAPVV
jgi:hypothetical protein